jgi:DNA-binding beta-propeller fold protein YncE
MRQSRQTAESRACYFTLLALLFSAAGCVARADSPGKLDLVWGRRGFSDGRFQKPRAIAINAKDQLYIVDMTARIQVFDADGNFLRVWSTPDHAIGRPTGMNFDRDGNLLVADTHYFRLLIYSPVGKLLRTIGGTQGPAPGQFGFVTDAVQDAAGYYYISQYGDYDRIQKYTRDGQFVLAWGGHGDKPGEFDRPQSIELDDQNRLWVTDAGNHRIQVFDTSGKLLFTWGHEGSAPGELFYPYGLKLDGQGHVYICEFGNNRIQKFTLDGKSLACWGSAGRQPGELANPWGIVRDSRGRIHIIDSENHRVQRIWF